MKRGIGTLITAFGAFAGGMLAGFLLTPKSGRENRRWLATQTDEAKHWLEDKSHKIAKESEKRIDRVSKGIKRTLHDNIPDLYEATEELSFDEEEDTEHA